jgi:glutamine synthetase
MDGLAEFIRRHKITEVECVVPDMSGIARGKIIPAEKLLRILRDRGLRIPEAVFIQTVTGEYPGDEDVTSDTNGDVYLVPDERTIRLVPWYSEPTALVICDAVQRDGSPVEFSARYVLRRILQRYEEKKWQPLVAPELEFFLVEMNKDPDYPLVPPIGRSGRQESGRQAYGIDAVNEFDPITELVYRWCEAQEIDVDTLSHEVGAAQIEINFNHGNALDLADQVFLFKRTVREAALRHRVYATFMAKPMKGEPGSAMHIHQSVVDAETGQNLFSAADGNDTPMLLSYIAGLQKFLPAAMPLMAPNVNSYRRLIQGQDSPINLHWGQDNRTAGLRVPVSGREDRRVENRLAGADANPYLALAGSLACGFLGIENEMVPSDPVRGSAHRLAFTLPRHQFEALNKLNASKPLREILGERFVDALTAVKEAEYDAYQRVISSWERENLLLNV